MQDLAGDETTVSRWIMESTMSSVSPTGMPGDHGDFLRIPYLVSF